MNFLVQLLPAIVVLAAAVVILLLSSWWKKINSEFLLVAAVVGLAASVWFSWVWWLKGVTFFGTSFPLMFTFDKLSLVGFIFIALTAALVLIASHNYLMARKLPWGEFLVLALFAVFGAYVLISATNLVMFILGLETLSLSAYVMAGYDASNALSREAAIKYFIMGAVASAIIIFGIAFYYGATGSLDLAAVSTNAPMLRLASGLIIAGLFFKIAAVPFQWWTPDVYQGAPLPVTSFFATIVKTAAFMALFRVMPSLDAVVVIPAVAIATMTFGNLAALWQDNIKRMLAYSSIAHAGYILLAFTFFKANPAVTSSSMMFYLLTYMMMTLGAFAVLVHLSDAAGECADISALTGLGKKSPYLALAMTVFLLSLAGFPPTGGFFAKFYLFKAVVQHGHVGLVIVAVINSLISVYYYMRPVVSMYFGAGEMQKGPAHYYSTAGVIIFCLIMVMLLGLFPSTILTILQ